jgi:hypothetical protein
LIVTTVIFVIGCVLNFAFTEGTQHYVAPWYRLAEAAALAIALVVAALTLPRRSPATASRPRRAPAPRTVGIVAFVLASAYLMVPFVADALTAWGSVAVQVTLVVVATILLVGWGRRAGWGPRSVLAVAVAVLAAYTWQGYKNVGLNAEGVVFLVGNILLDLLMLQLARVAFSRTPANDPDHAADPDDTAEGGAVPAAG